MTLTFELATARDALAKAKREYQALEEAITTQDKTRIGDCLFNFSVSVYHVKDWLIENPSSAYSKSDVEAVVNATPSLLLCRDLCNASKHRKIKRYTPNASSVTASLSSALTVVNVNLMAKPGHRKPPFRVKVIAKDGKRLEVLSLARDATAAWDAFFQQHGL